MDLLLAKECGIVANVNGVRRVDGSKIRFRREALKGSTNGRQGSQAWLAAQIGSHVTSVSDWERGANQPSARHLRAIADVLGVPMEQLYADDDEEDSLSQAQLDRDLLVALRRWREGVAA